jgi:hypothetical protein
LEVFKGLLKALERPLKSSKGLERPLKGLQKGLKAF